MYRYFVSFFISKNLIILKINEICLASELNYSENLNILRSSTTTKNINKLRLHFFLHGPISYRIRNPSLYPQKATIM